jgi:flagellar biosynthetic protein FliR
MLEQELEDIIFQFLLIFTRFGAMFNMAAAAGVIYTPLKIRVAAVFWISAVMIMPLAPYLPLYNAQYFVANIEYLAIELLVGLILGVTINIYFQTTQVIGQIISLQSGLSAAAFFDPVYKSQVTVFSSLISILTIAMVFATNTHHIFIEALFHSYQKFMPGEMMKLGDLSEFIVKAVNDSFVLAFKMASPFIVVGLAIMTGNGMLARLMPNLQVFFVVTPLQILIIFCIMYIIMHNLIEKLIKNLTENLFYLVS